VFIFLLLLISKIFTFSSRVFTFPDGLQQRRKWCAFRDQVCHPYLERLLSFGCARMDAQSNDSAGGLQSFDLTRRVITIHDWHLQVHQNHLGVESLDKSNGCQSITGFPDDLDIPGER
jgi:hypothetical protein